MSLLLNESSIAEQFLDGRAFEQAISLVMSMRATARRFGHEIHCHRNILTAKVSPTLSIREAVQVLSPDRRRLILQWLTSYGPFWSDDPQHSPDDYLECRGVVVTDTAIGEAGFRTARGLDCRLVSLVPSDWQSTPIQAQLFRDSGEQVDVEIRNYWELPPLEVELSALQKPIGSWPELKERAGTQFEGLLFADSTFTALTPCPFSYAAAERILQRLAILNKIATCRLENGSLTSEGQELCATFFQGERALFSDSSDTEKQQMGRRLLFAHPHRSDEVLSCPWHGKISTQVLRVHFSWPEFFNSKIYVPYVGPKLTKR